MFFGLLLNSECRRASLGLHSKLTMPQRLTVVDDARSGNNIQFKDYF
jgi:hypothetical protein